MKAAALLLAYTLVVCVLYVAQVVGSEYAAANSFVGARLTSGE